MASSAMELQLGVFRTLPTTKVEMAQRKCTHDLRAHACVSHVRHAAFHGCLSSHSDGSRCEWHTSLMNYRLITAYLLLRVNLDKIMHARWNFDVSSARTRRVSALDRRQNWSASALFCLNSHAQRKYAVLVNLIIHDVNKLFFVFYYVINMINKTF